MKKHSLYGGKILEKADSELLQMAHQIALSHHEHYDGTGYPQGLKGEAIPLEARVVALADVFDALTHKRVYKEAWDVERVLKYIREQAGRQFDPKIVDAFLRVFPAMQQILIGGILEG